jgi:hypothetical protein
VPIFIKIDRCLTILYYHTMYKQITPTFAPVPSIVFELLKDKFIMENSQKLTAILLEKNMPLDTICKIVKNYIKIYSLIKDVQDITCFTAEFYIEYLKEKYKDVS